MLSAANRVQMLSAVKVSRWLGGPYRWGRRRSGDLVHVYIYIYIYIYMYTHIIHMHACIHYIMLRRVALHCIASHHVTLHYIHTWYMQCTCIYIYIYDVSAKGLNDQNLLISPMPCPAHSGRNNKQFKRFWGPPPELPQGGAFTIWMLGKTPNPPE